MKHQRACLNLSNRSFKDSWLSIQEKANLKNDFFLYKNDFHEDQFFDDAPYIQEFLTEDDKTFYNQIEYSNYYQLQPEQINNNNLYDCFHGILFYIYYYSENKLNTQEVEFHFSHAKSRKKIDSLKQNKVGNNNDHSDILNIFNYDNIQTQFTINCAKNAFFGFTFKRIKVNPISYSIRSGSIQGCISHLVSFTFEGYDEENKKWDILDERVNINNLIPSGGFSMFYVRNTSKYYSSFQIKQTEPGSNGFWGFSIAAFDIHGLVSLRENKVETQNNLLEESQSFSLDLPDYNKFDPTMDMTEFFI